MNKIIVRSATNKEIQQVIRLLYELGSIEIHIPKLIVRKKYQRNGIGMILIDVCLDLAKNKKFHRIMLESGNQRIESHRFYQALVFEQSVKSFTKIIKK